MEKDMDDFFKSEFRKRSIYCDSGDSEFEAAIVLDSLVNPPPSGSCGLIKLKNIPNKISVSKKKHSIKWANKNLGNAY